MERVADGIAAAFRNRPTDVDVLYYKPEQASAFAKSFDRIWSEVATISTEDLAADLAADPNDVTFAYRLRGRDRVAGQP
jgi:threonine dehydratase